MSHLPAQTPGVLLYFPALHFDLLETLPGYLAVLFNLLETLPAFLFNLLESLPGYLALIVDLLAKSFEFDKYTSHAKEGPENIVRVLDRALSYMIMISFIIPMI